MRSVTINKRGFLLDGKTELPAVSGEFHYWRTGAGFWDTILDSCIELGMKVIATYVPWAEHELSPSVFDFDGHTRPELNLTGFLELVQKKGLFCIVRPGPYIYAEQLNLGVPEYVTGFHRNSDEFKTAALPYIKAISEVIKPFLYPAGGNIIAFQPDNEINAWPFWYWRDLGLDGGGEFEIFLRTQYNSVAELNRAWGSDFDVWSDVKATALPEYSVKEDYTAFADQTRYFYYLALEQGIWNIQAYKDCGIDGVPYYHNLLGAHSLQDWLAFSKQVDFVGADSYPLFEFKPKTSGNVFGIGTDAHLGFVSICKCAAEIGPIGYLAEYQGGYPSCIGGPDFYRLTTNHYRMSMVTALGCGITGWNIFMLVDREHWCDAPISNLGILNQYTGEEFKFTNELIERFHLNRAERKCSLAVLWDPLTETFGSTTVEKLRNELYCSGLDYRMLNPADQEGFKKVTHIVAAGLDNLSSEMAENISNFVKQGGTFIICGNASDIAQLPLQKTERLLKFPYYAHSFNATIDNATLTFAQPVYTWKDGIENAITGIVTPKYDGVKLNMSSRMKDLDYLIGYKKTFEKGTIIHLGGVPDSGWIDLLAVSNYQPVVKVTPANTFISTLEIDGKKLFAVVSIADQPTLVQLSLTNPEASSKKYREIYSDRCIEVVNGNLLVEIDRKSAVMLLEE